MTYVLELVQQRGQVCVLRACICGGRGRRGVFLGRGVEADDVFLVEVQLAVECSFLFC